MKRKSKLKLKKMIISIGKTCIIAFFCFSISFTLKAQNKHFTVDSIPTNTSALIIGLDALDENIVWASGTAGTVLRSKDGGSSWEVFNYSLADSLQFRAIKGLSEDEALVMSAGDGAASQLLKFSVTNGWEQLYIMPFENGFLDAIEIFPNGTGIAYGDAVDSSYFILKSDKKLRNWRRIEKTPLAGKGEGGFASSGSNIAIGKNGAAWIGTGAGGHANILKTTDNGQKWSKTATPIIKGAAAGITAIRQLDGLLFITGGDLAISDQYTNNLFITQDENDNWVPLEQPITKGAFYGSAINKWHSKLIYIVCGPAGADIRLPNGIGWQNISTHNLWTAEFINKKTALLAGRNGYLIKVTLLD